MTNYAMLFPGQGSQYVGMGKTMYDSSSVAQRLFKEAEELLEIPLRKLCFEGDMSDLTLTYHAQPAILTVGYIGYRLFMDKYGRAPLYLLGHSLGEITALTCAGALSFEDAVKIVQRRGILMHEAALDAKGTMTSIQGVPLDLVQTVCEFSSSDAHQAVVSNINAASQIVISGHESAVRHVSNLLVKMGATAIPLHVSAPFHSPLMASAEESFRQYIGTYPLATLASNVVSNVDAQVYADESQVAAKLSRQLTSPVRWTDCIRYITKAGISLAVEMGPKSVLKKLAADTPLTVHALDDREDASLLERHFGQMPEPRAIDFIKGCLTQSVCTKNRNFDATQYEQGVINQVRALEQLIEKAESQQGHAPIEDIYKALDALLIIFETKKVAEQEKRQRLAKLCAKTLPMKLIEKAAAYVQDQTQMSIA